MSTRNFTAREQVLLDYAHLQDGETINGEVCPDCRGGVSGDKSLSITRRDGALLWVCYRDSCKFSGCSGRSYIDGARATQLPSTRGFAGRSITRGSAPLPEEVREDLYSRYSVGAELTSAGGFGWDTETNRLIMPVRNYRGDDLGCVLRSLSGAKPKVISHTEKGAMAWYVNHTTPGVIIVEDQLSALRASRYLTSVALLGTNLSEERVAEIKKSGLTPVFLALDNDAIASAVKYVVKYRSVLPLQLVRLDKDIKDMSHEEAEALCTSALARQW